MTVDSRFYASSGALTLEAAAAITGSELFGNGGKPIAGVASAALAGPGDIAFIEGGEKEVAGLSPEAGAVIVSEKIRSAIPEQVAVLVAKYPRHAHAELARALFSPREIEASEQAISPDAVIADNCSIGHGVVIGAGAVIGAGTQIGANTVIGCGVQIGRACRIGSNVTIGFALVGDHVTVLSGARIGESGFGLITGPDGVGDAPHLGRVIIQDHVSIGANSCIDRGVFEDTIIGERTKIDNLCQIAHNVVLGR